MRRATFAAAAVFLVVATGASAGQPEKADALADEILKTNPDFTAEHAVRKIPRATGTHAAHYLASLRRAGLR